jgi:protease II
MKKIAALATVLLCLTASAQEDPYLWLEEVTGQKPLEWVKAQNEITRPLLEATPTFDTRVSYLVVMRENLALDGRNPTILHGYGGFEVSQVPGHSAALGPAAGPRIVDGRVRCPDVPADREFIGSCSPHPNFFKDWKDPKVFTWTTTRE